MEISDYGLIAHEILHGLVALPFMVIVWNKTKSYLCVLIVVLTAYFLDLDHLIDYFIFYGFQFSLSGFLSSKYFGLSNRAYVFFHAWEWFFILSLVSLKSGWKSYFTAFSLGLLSHLILDAINVKSFVFYSIIYRASHYFTFYH